MDTIQKIIFTVEERKYRERLLAGDSSNILNCDVTCTVCGGKLNWMLFSKKPVLVHPILEVLLCEGCSISRTMSEWPGMCVWCGGNGANQENLLNCSQCPLSFCESCVRVNFGLRGIDRAKLTQPEWECYICRPHELWILRAVCDAFKGMIQGITK